MQGRRTELLNIGTVFEELNLRQELRLEDSAYIIRIDQRYRQKLPPGQSPTYYVASYSIPKSMSENMIKLSQRGTWRRTKATIFNFVIDSPRINQTIVCSKSLVAYLGWIYEPAQEQIVG